MIISERLVSALQAQAANELRNRMAYKAMSSWAHVRGLKGIAKYFDDQSDDELGHHNKFLSYLSEANVQIQVPPIPPTVTYTDCDSIASAYREIEAKTTDELDAIWDVAVADKDWGTQDFLQGLSREQISEIAEAERFANLVMMANGDLIKLDLMFS